MSVKKGHNADKLKRTKISRASERQDHNFVFMKIATYNVNSIRQQLPIMLG